MSWKLEVPAGPFNGFEKAVDDAQPQGEVGKDGAGAQITQAKAVLVALAKAGVLGSGKLEASAAGNGSAPYNFIVSVREVDGQAAAAPAAAPVDLNVQPGPQQAPGAVGGAPAPQQQAGVEVTGVTGQARKAQILTELGDPDLDAASRANLLAELKQLEGIA